MNGVKLSHAGRTKLDKQSLTRPVRQPLRKRMACCSTRTRSGAWRGQAQAGVCSPGTARPFLRKATVSYTDYYVVADQHRTMRSCLRHPSSAPRLWIHLRGPCHAGHAYARRHPLVTCCQIRSVERSVVEPHGRCRCRWLEGHADAPAVLPACRTRYRMTPAGLEPATSGLESQFYDRRRRPCGPALRLWRR